MKKLLLIMVSLLLTSCFTSIPQFGNKPYPFIVIKIEDIGNGYSIYTGEWHASTRPDVMCADPKISLPSRLFNIGDTIPIPTLIKK